MKNYKAGWFALIMSALFFSQAYCQTFEVPVNSTDSIVRISVTKIKKQIVTAPPVDTITPPSTGTLIYSNNYDKSSDINSNQLGAGSISTTIFKSGTGSFKSVVPAGSEQISGGWRSEQQLPETLTPNNTGLIIEYDIYFETLPTVTGLAVQWHGNTQGTSGQLAMWINSGKFMVMRNTIGTAGSDNIYQEPPLKSIELRKWYHFKWELKFTSGNTGYVKCFIDNDLYYSVTGKTSDGSGQYMKPGQNLFAKPATTSVLYIDNLRIYRL
jgi:hypothetical protein